MTDCTRALEQRPDRAHLEACAACRELTPVVDRHRALLVDLARPAPEALSDRSFLDGIYARAAQALADATPAGVAAVLAAPVQAPEECDDRLLESPDLHALEPTRAPGMLGPRLAADIRRIRRQRRGARRRMRIAQGVAAVAVVALALWATRTEATVVDEPVIVRLEASGPFAPGFSASEIVRRVAGAADGGAHGR